MAREVPQLDPAEEAAAAAAAMGERGDQRRVEAVARTARRTILRVCALSHIMEDSCLLARVQRGDWINDCQQL